MDHNFWHRRWQKNEIGFHEAHANDLLVSHLDKLNLSSNSRIFLPLCGKTLDIDWLLAQGYQVIGIELNLSAVNQLFERLQVTPERAVINQYICCYQTENLMIFQGDILKLSRSDLGHVDALYDRAALVALPEDMRTKYTQHLVNICPKTSQLLVVFEYDQNQMAGPPFSVSAADIHHMYQHQYTITHCQKRIVPDGLRNVSAQESAWLLSPR